MKDYNEIIDRLEVIRRRNNGNWMDMFRLGFAHDPVAAAEIGRRIFACDMELLVVAKELYE